MTKMIAAAILLNILACIQGGLTSPLDPQTSIVNGERAGAGEIPYQISLHQNGQHNCGGSVINENYVLTAAHCVSRTFAQSLSVIAGTVSLDNMSAGASKHRVTSVKVHEQYNEGDSWRNDVALLRVEPPFKFSANLAPAQLPGAGETLNEKQPAIVSGFGLTSTNGVISRNLLKTNVYIQSNANCQKTYLLNRIYPTNVCSMNPNSPATGFCRGDSGGPLSVSGKVVGVVSYALNNGCAAVAKEPQVYTRVSEFISWITANSQDDGSYPPPNYENPEDNDNNDITENWENNNNNNNNGINNPSNDFTDWINSQDHSNPNWLNDLNKKYQEWLQKTG